jgi:hypothetical protein
MKNDSSKDTSPQNHNAIRIKKLFDSIVTPIDF